MTWRGPDPRISLDEFLELEIAADYRSEYEDEKVFAMAGATYEQAVIASNLVGALGRRLRGEDCRVIGSGLLVAVVIRGEPRFVGLTRLVVSNPVPVVEVFAGGRAMAYRKNWTLQQCVLVPMDEARVAVLSRAEDGEWSERDGGDGGVGERWVRAAFGRGLRRGGVRGVDG